MSIDVAFQSQTRRLLPRNLKYVMSELSAIGQFQSQTRRLLPRNRASPAQDSIPEKKFQSQTRRLLPRNQLQLSIQVSIQLRFNRRRDACFLATCRGRQRGEGSWLFQSQTRRLLPRNG